MKTIKTANDQEEIEKSSKKKKSGQPKNDYFSEAEEVAVKDFLMSEDYTEKEKIFNERLLPAFKKATASFWATATSATGGRSRRRGRKA